MDFTWIDSTAAVTELVDTCTRAPWVVLDLEANSMYVYREQVCLIQINAGGRLFVLDTLALPAEPATLAGLKPLLENPQKPLWVHGGEYDVGCLKRDFAIAPRGIFDSQQAASFLGWEKTGYGAIIERICNVVLPKGHSQYDWATRPLDPSALAYAVDDVRYLPDAVQHLQEAIQAADLEEEVAIANATVENSTWSGGFDASGFWRLKGIRDLNDRALPTLAGLWAWRDERAHEANLPPGRLIANDALLAIARNAPTNYGGFKKLGLKSWVLQAHADSLVELMKAVRENPPAIPERPGRRDVTEAERLREIRLKDWRRSEAEKRGVPLQVVLPAKALEYLKQHSGDDLSHVPQFGNKRRERYGSALQRVCSSP